MLIASTGGHLTQLSLLRGRIRELTDVSWVTFDTDQSRSLLAGQRVHFVRDVPPRDGLGAVRALASAARIMRLEQPDVVMSTGAAIALPYLTTAAAQRRTALYIESAARVDAPSLTGRLTRRVPTVRVYAQSRRMPAGWPYAGSVFDSFGPDDTPPPAVERPRVLVALGTMAFDFSRLVRRLVELLPAEADVVWQLGHTPAPVGRPADEVHRFLPQAEMARHLGRADVVVTHAGVGTTLGALAAGHRPVLVPRLARFGEHIDDHQLETGQELARAGLVTLREVEHLHADDLARAGRVRLREDAPDLDLDLSRRRSRRARG